jgi:adenylosuccinate lyase
MQDEPTSLRIEDPGVRAPLTERARFQAWLDVEAALAQAQPGLGVIPAGAALEAMQAEHEADRTASIMMSRALAQACELTGDMLR